VKKIYFGAIHANYLALDQALDAIEDLAKSGNGGFVVTPNIDHVVLAQKNEKLRSAYKDASLSLVDSMPLKWISSLMGDTLPEKLSGSDIIHPILRRAAKTGLRVYFLGSEKGVGDIAAKKLKSEIKNLNITGIDSPHMGFEKDPEQEQKTIDKMVAARPNLVLMALGCPKQELLMHKWYKKTAPIVYIGIGAGLDFIAGKVKRAPSWMSSMGMEWIFRLSQDPKRLAHRYLVRDSAMLKILLKMAITPKNKIIVQKD
jgi:N-acetylglucosaminyldiphosphoundecaprenol N-acetyl-beta-D-mannosaminyltransferase